MTDDAGNDELEVRHTYIGSPSNINSASASGDLNVVDISSLECGGVLSYQSVTEANIDGFAAKPDGFWFFLVVRDSTTSESITLIENSGDTTTSIRTPNVRDWRLTKNDSVMLVYSNNRWRVVASHPKPWAAPTDSVTWSAQTDDFARAGRGYYHIRVTLAGGQTLTGVVPDGVTPNGELLYLENVDATDTLALAHDSSASAAANRFFLPGGDDLQLTPRTGALLRYDATSSRWRCMAFSSRRRETANAGAGVIVTNSATETQIAALTLTANTILVGKTLDLYCAVTVSRGGTTTASNFTLQVTVGSAVVYTETVAVDTTAFSSGIFRVTGKIAMNTVGASGSAGAIVDMLETVSSGGSSSLGSAGGSVDTTAAVTITITGKFSAAVSGLSWSCGTAVVADE